MLVFDGAALHCATGHCKEGASMSVSVRLGLPLLVLYIAGEAADDQETAKDIALVTFLIADLLDITLAFAYDFEEEARKKQDASKPKLTVMPARGGGAVVGIAGGF
jgi:hypothetical protein